METRRNRLAPLGKFRATRVFSPRVIGKRLRSAGHDHHSARCFVSCGVNEGPIFVVDDDPAVGLLTSHVLEEAGFTVRSFRSGGEFLESSDPSVAACVVSDLRMPGFDGGELLRRLRSAGCPTAIVIVTAHADVRTAVKLMEDGALTILEKPFQPAELVDVVRRAVVQTGRLRAAIGEAAEFHHRLSQLTPDALAVLDCIMAGMSNKSIVAKLDISPRTLDRRKQAILSTLGVESTAELVAGVARARAPSAEGDGFPQGVRAANP